MQIRSDSEEKTQNLGSAPLVGWNLGGVLISMTQPTPVNHTIGPPPVSPKSVIASYLSVFDGRPNYFLYYPPPIPIPHLLPYPIFPYAHVLAQQPPLPLSLMKTVFIPAPQNPAWFADAHTPALLPLQQSPALLLVQQNPASLSVQQSPASLPVQQSSASLLVQQSSFSLPVQQSPSLPDVQQSPATLPIQQESKHDTTAQSVYEPLKKFTHISIIPNRLDSESTHQPTPSSCKSHTSELNHEHSQRSSKTIAVKITDYQKYHVIGKRSEPPSYSDSAPEKAQEEERQPFDDSLEIQIRKIRNFWKGSNYSYPHILKRVKIVQHKLTDEIEVCEVLDFSGKGLYTNNHCEEKFFAAI